MIAIVAMPQKMAWCVGGKDESSDNIWYNYSLMGCWVLNIMAHPATFKKGMRVLTGNKSENSREKKNAYDVLRYICHVVLNL